jgi:hypothetical protein
MPSTVFFSWQADTPSRIGRSLLHDVLEDACRALGADNELTDAARGLTVDSDTRGTAGSPPIVETIFRKIDAASVFVADMTFVAERSGGGRSPNPNVLIEYGWALKSLGYERIICIMNTAYGAPSGEALPFDLRHARWPLQYELRTDASPEEKRVCRGALIKMMTSALRACLGVAAVAPPPPQRAPVRELRTWAIAAGWNGDVQSATVGDNDWWSFTQRLRQAGADGAIDFSGRRYIYDFGKEVDSEPIIAIPREHFGEFGLDVVELASADNYNIFTGKLGESSQTLKGSIFRDLHVNDQQARAWLAAAGKPPAPADMAVRIDSGGTQLGDYLPVATLFIRNIGGRNFERCLVEMAEFSGVVPRELPMPLALRTQTQIRADERGRFLLSAGQEVAIPRAFRRAQRANEWYLIDDSGKAHFFSANPTKMLLQLHGGPSPGSAVAFIDTDAGWSAIPSVRTVPSGFSLWSR